MTTFIDETETKEKVQKKTKFVKHICGDGDIDNAEFEPSNFDFVKLIRRRDERYEYDLFVAYDEGQERINELWYFGEAGDEFLEELKNEKETKGNNNNIC